jgi:starch phosphorylase
VDSLLDWDEFMLLADYRAYVDCQATACQAYKKSDTWTRLSILNVARIGYFSSDRSIREYCEQIWKIAPVAIESADRKTESATSGKGGVLEG